MTQVRNLIYIHTHDMGRYVAPYGYAIPTPGLEKIADYCTLFRKAFCCGPTCSPSRAGLLTGMTPHQTGMLGLAHRGFKLSHPERHLGSFLKRHGFETVLCGMQHEFNSSWEDMPYEHVHARHEEGGDWLETDQAAASAAASFLKEKHERPFFLSFGLFYPHRPFPASDPLKYPPGRMQPPAPLPDLPVIRKDMADYQYAVHLADECIARVWEAIQQSGRDKDSLIILTTDHGIAFPDMKCHLTDHGIGVTLMINYPGNPQAGQAVDALVSHLDVYPTVCDVLGLDAPDHLQGHSLRPLMEGSATRVRDEIFSEVTFHASYEPLRCIRTERYKLIRRFGFSKRPLANCDNSESKDILLDLGWGEETLPAVEFYDLMTDPHEACNLASSPKHASLREALENRLQLWMQETNDPLLNGDVVRPAGALVNSADCIDPADGPFEPIL